VSCTLNTLPAVHISSGVWSELTWPRWTRTVQPVLFFCHQRAFHYLTPLALSPRLFHLNSHRISRVKALPAHLTRGGVGVGGRRRRQLCASIHFFFLLPWQLTSTRSSCLLSPASPAISCLIRMSKRETTGRTPSALSVPFSRLSVFCYITRTVVVVVFFHLCVQH